MFDLVSWHSRIFKDKMGYFDLFLVKRWIGLL